jgi:hypothetical protein
MEKEKYRILIVDENPDQIDDFYAFFDALGNSEFKVFSIEKLERDEDLLSFINDNEIDSVAFDYKLMENNSEAFSQNGDAYQNMLLEHFENFPTFIITNNAHDSVYMNADPFRIISKEIVLFDSANDEQKQKAVDLIEKIKLSIDRYKDNLSSIEDELYKLIELQNNGESLKNDDLKKMVDLDNKLENSISKKTKIPPEWKSPSAIQAITDLVSNSNDILNELKKLNNE